ncbi:hypothetical protein [Actinoplanes teichomyceticus]|uniref:Uncharacterized protein n=1 Tax=Actinoplanes teichomyceticus TaxID=1867 RepID=A0A561VGE8_ACTTI|nr:hypothetical protein [Actinoplanes teichomyceticus]TWG10683.1 hypothetical protein FHX34_107177 [Actinoplanes teichomyceticus]GIF15452.1 hypothetical protein Ate01nite_54840 [Actinoplanes teichomyceticus]
MAERPQSDLGAVLRQEAERHVPDSEAMFARINRRRATPVRHTAPPRTLWGFAALRPVAAAFSVAATLVAGFTGIRLLTGDDPRDTPAATTGTPSAAPTSNPPLPPATTRPAPGTSDRPQQTGGGDDSPTRTRSGRTPSSAPPSFQPVSGFASSTGVINPYSTETWAQSDVAITTTRELTALDVAISVTRTEGVQNTGSWSTIPNAMIKITLTEEKEALIYRFTLVPGGTLAAGTYTFAAQYQHAPGKRDPSRDLYRATASGGGRKAEVTGTFVAAG